MGKKEKKKKEKFATGLISTQIKKKKLKKIGEKLSSIFMEEIEGELKEELNIEYENCNDPIGKEFIEKQFGDVFTKEQYKILDDDSLFLYYRGINSISRVSDPKYEPDDEKLKEKDPILNITGCFYLLANSEDTMKYERRRSPIELDIILRLKYINYHCIGILNGNTAFFVESILLDTTKRIKDKSLQQARIKALTFMTHLAVDQDQPLREKITDLKLDLKKKLKELDEKRDKELIGMLRSGEVDNILKRNFGLEKANLTSVLIGVFCFALGILIAVSFMMKGEKG